MHSQMNSANLESVDEHERIGMTRVSQKPRLVSVKSLASQPPKSEPPSTTDALRAAVNDAATKSPKPTSRSTQPMEMDERPPGGASTLPGEE